MGHFSFHAVAPGVPRETVCAGLTGRLARALLDRARQARAFLDPLRTL